MSDRTTLDTIFSGALSLEQPARGHGYRFNVDALLLAREALQSGKVESTADLGTGCGVAGLALRFLGGCHQLLLVEQDPWMASLAQHNAAIFENVWVKTCDVETLYEETNWDQVICNPPYTLPKEGRLCPEPRRASARSGELDPFLRATERILSTQGRALFIYPSQGLPILLEVASRYALFPRRIRLVHPTPTRPARVVLLELRRTDGLLVVSPPWFERDKQGQPDPSLTTFLTGISQGNLSP